MGIKVISDKEFDDELAKTRHKELKSALDSIALSLDNKNEDEVISAIGKQTDAIKGFVDVVSNLSQPISVETNQNLVVDSVKEMGKKMLDGLEDVKKALLTNTNKKWEFKVTRNYAGYIVLVEAESINNENKAQA